MILPQETAAAPTALDLALIRKYSGAAPRYTSYPPATKFTAEFAAPESEAAIAADNAPGAGPLSLYFHLPFCESLCWYCGCNTVITTRREAAAEYVDDLGRELRLTAALIDRRRPVTQIHFGGGTPTFLPPRELERLGGLIREWFYVAPDCEFGVEIDPRRLTLEHVEALKRIGANRASLGVQDTDPAVQLAIHRWQPAALTAQAFAWLRAAEFASVNVDLIYGLPRQTEASFGRTIDEVLALAPDRLSVFSYAHVPWMRPAQKIFETRGELPSPESKLAMFAVAHTKLTDAGYIDIGLDHFARPDDELARARRDGTLHRNFQGYSTGADASLYGFGVSSISSTAGSYRQNCKDLDGWRQAVRAQRLPVERGLGLTAEDRRRRTLIMSLMCERRLDYTALSAELGVDVAVNYAAEIARLEPLERDGLVERTPRGVRVTPRGGPLLRIIAACFDATLAPAAHRHAAAV